MKWTFLLLPLALLVVALWQNRAAANPPGNNFTLRSRTVVQGNGTLPACGPAGCVAPGSQAIYSQQALQAPILQAPLYAAPVLAAPLYSQPLLAANLGAYSQTVFQTQNSFRQRLFSLSSYGNPFNARLGLNFNFRRR